MKCPAKPKKRRFCVPGGRVVIADRVVPSATCDYDYVVYGHFADTGGTVLPTEYYANEELPPE